VAYGDQKFGIKATGLLSVLGSVTYDHNNSSYVIENPILLATSKDRVLSNLGH
jgi:hypothetical protein